MQPAYELVEKCIKLNSSIVKASKKDTISKAYFNIADACLLLSELDKSQQEASLKRAISHYYKSGSVEALKKALEIVEKQGYKPAFLNKICYDLGDFTFSQEKNYIKAAELYKRSIDAATGEKNKIIVDAFVQMALAYGEVRDGNKLKAQVEYNATEYFPALYQSLELLTNLPSALIDLVFNYYTGRENYNQHRKDLGNAEKLLDELLGDCEDI